MRNSLLHRLFPHQYHPAVWVPAALLMAGLVALEALLHELLTPHSSGSSRWAIINDIAYAAYFIPFVLPSVRSVPGFLRRLIVALIAQTLAATVALILLKTLGRATPSFLLCFQVANLTLVAFAVATHAPRGLRWAGVPGAILGGLSAILGGDHGWTDASLGAVFGWLTFRLAFWRELALLETPQPWIIAKHFFNDLLNKSSSNQQARWEEAYSGGYWEFLKSEAQRPRHYVIAGLVNDHAPRGSVLDVGCGQAVLIPLLHGSVGHYTGLDLSEAVIDQCRAAYGDDPRCDFAASDFLHFAPPRKYDVVIFNEVLYYLPLKAVRPAFEKARASLRPGGWIIVSMNKNLKARLVWGLLSSFGRPRASVKVLNRLTGSFWTVTAYAVGPK